MRLSISRVGAKLQRITGWSRPINVTIAGEPFVIDGSCGARGELNDYDYAWLRALARGQRCVLDIGSNIGVTALLLARHMDPDGTCILADLWSDNLQLAARNLYRARLLARAAFARLRIDDCNHAGVSRLAANIVARGAELHGAMEQLRALDPGTPSCTIDHLCAAMSLTPGLMKVDVEGAEQAVLRGASETVARCQPAIQVELHSFPPSTMRANAQHTLEWCAARRYRMWYLASGAPVEIAEQLAHRGRCHVLLLPSNAPYPSGLLDIPQNGNGWRSGLDG